MKNIFGTAFFLLAQAVFVFSQDIDFTKNNFIGKENQLKEAQANIKKGDDFFRGGPNVYYRALNFYLKANDFNPQNALLNYKIGVCYLYSPFKHKAVQYLEKAKKINPETDIKLYYYLGEAYHLGMQWNTAIELFENYKKRIASSKEKQTLDADKKIQECKNGMELTKDTARLSKLPDSLRYKIENLGIAVNSQYDDYHPVISADESVLFFTSRRAPIIGGGISDDGKYYEDIYVSNNENKKWTEAKNMGDPINTPNQNNATCGISVDGQTLYIYLDNVSEGTGNIYESRVSEHIWSTPKKLPKTINTKYHESSVSLSPDGKTLYFCSENPENNLGRHDIFVSTLGSDGQWKEPKNLSDAINTKYDENTVFIHPDGKTIYFSSEGHNSMGGHDLFKSVFNETTKKWSAPVNLGYPVNTADDDVDFVISANGKHAYNSTIRPDGLGGKDIYKITLPIDTTPQVTLVKGNVTDESKNPVGAKIEITDNVTHTVVSTQESNNATGKFLISLPSGKNYKMSVTANGYHSQQQDFNIPKGEKYKELDVNITMKRKEQLVLIEGNITDENGNPINGTIEIINNATGEVIVKTTIDKLGKYLSKLQAGKNYGIVVSSDGYLFQSINIDIPPDKERLKLPQIKLKKIEAGKNIVLNNIFFDFDKAILRADSKPELERVVKVLKDNPTMKIEISGHSDSKGSITYNLRLSELRAKSVVEFLGENGIDKTRLSFKGYGFLKPLASNDTEEGRQQNRRTEFKILEINGVKKTIPEQGKKEYVKPLPAEIAFVDKNNDQKISAEEMIVLINNFFDGNTDYTFERINYIINFFFEQE